MEIVLDRGEGESVHVSVINPGYSQYGGGTFQKPESVVRYVQDICLPTAKQRNEEVALTVSRRDLLYQTISNAVEQDISKHNRSMKAKGHFLFMDIRDLWARIVG